MATPHARPMPAFCRVPEMLIAVPATRAMGSRIRLGA